MLYTYSLYPSQNVITQSENTSLYAWGSNLQGNLGDGTTISRSTPIAISNFLNQKSFGSVVSGVTHSVVIGSNGSLWAWGSNNNGQLGDGTTIDKSSPVQIGTAYSWTAVSVVADSTIGLTTTGILFAWGNNSAYQLGDGTTIAKSSPVQIFGKYFTTTYDSWKAISSGVSYTLAIRSSNSSLWVWGSNVTGQLGDGTTIAKSNPVQIGTSSWVSVSAGVNSAGITTTGALYTWGTNTNAGLGQPGVGGSLLSPGQVTGLLPVTYDSWKMISIKFSHTAAIRSSDGSLWAWGSNGGGQLGDGTTISKSSPVQIGTSSWSMVSAGASHTAAITTTGALFIWGNNAFGQLGDGTTVNKSSPIQIGTSSWTIVSSGTGGLNNNTAGITNTGALFTWGSNSVGQLGDGTTIAKSSPVQIGTSSWSAVSVGDSHLVGLLADTGALFTWGSNPIGQLGDGTTINKSSPIQIGTSSWSAVSAGASHTAGITTTGSLFTWGIAVGGQLGDGTTIAKSSPVQIGTSSWSTISAAVSNSAAITTTGALFMWGLATSGQTGDGGIVNKSSPVQVATTYNIISSWTMVSVTKNGSFPWMAAIDFRGSLWTWGTNLGGNLGDGTTVNKVSPVQIGTSSWSAVSAGDSHLVGLLADTGALFTSGVNASGQLGDGTTINKSSPVQIGTSSWTMVSAGINSTGALTINKYLFTWGSGTNGLLGDGTVVNKSSPVQIGVTKYQYDSWKMVSAGIDRSTNDYTLAIRTSDSSLWGWGGNSLGVLGDGTTTDKTAPVKIGTSSWAYISAGTSTSAGITVDGKLFTWGSGYGGMLGDGTTVNKSSPVQIGTGSSWTFVSAARGSLGGNGYAISIAGALFGWGVGPFGDLSAFRSSPAQIGTNSWTFVTSSASGHYGITTTGILYGWGPSNSFGQIGDGTTITRSSATALAGTWKSVASIAGNATYGLKTDGTIWSWGLNLSGQLGDGTVVNKSSPVQVGGFNDWHSIGSSTAQIAAWAARGGVLYAWGSNGSYQLGDGTIASHSSPVVVTLLPSQSYISVSMGNSHTVALGIDGSLYTWGLNNPNQLGDGTTITRSQPFQLGTTSQLIYTWNAISISQHALALDNTNNLWAWGLASSNQLGLNDINAKSSPMLVSTVSGSSFSVISAGTAASLAITTTGSLWTWGSNLAGESGFNSAASYISYPTQTGYTLGQESSFLPVISSGYGSFAHAIGATTSKLYSWGSNSLGQLGVYHGINGLYPFATPDLNEQIYPQSTSSWKYISGGVSYAAAITSDGSLWTWGNNLYGQLGDGTTILKSVPIKIGTSSWSAVSAGISFTAGITTTGALFAWGRNLTGQLGDGTTIAKSSPVQIGTSSWSMVSAGYNMAAGITTTGALFTWGGNSFGGLGDGTTIAKSSPVQIGTSSWSMVASDPNNVNLTGFNGAITTAGALFTWGYSQYGVGDGTTTNRSSPVQIGTSSWTKIAIRNNTVALISINGSLWTWGSNNNGQLGDGTTVNKSSPIQIGTSSWSMVALQDNGTTGLDIYGNLYSWGQYPANGTTVSSPVQIGTLSPSVVQPIFYGSSWSFVGSHFAIDINNNLYGWGQNLGSILGLGTTVVKSSPVFISTTNNPTNIKKITTTGSGTTTILDGAGIQTIGSGTSGELGDFTIANRNFLKRIKVISNPSAINTTISSGASHSAAIIDNFLYTWGLGTSAQLGDGSLNTKSTPTLIPLNIPYSTQTSWKMISSGLTHTVAIRASDSSLWAWGLNTSGQLGDGTLLTRFFPIKIGNSSWTTVSAGLIHSMGITTAGNLFAWGNNTGQLGDGTAVNKSLPIQITVAKPATYDSWKFISVNTSQAAAIRASDSSLWIWGGNTSGQLGDGTTINKSSPVRIGTSSWSMVAAGVSFTAGITTTGTLYAWGYNNFGDLGDGTTISKSSPVTVSTLNLFSKISCGTDFSLAIDNSGMLWSWGLNTSGQLGDGTTINKSSPVQIGTSSWTIISASYINSAGITTTGALFTWGNNTAGQLGDGTTIAKSSPVQIGTSSWTAVSTGASYMMGITTTGGLFTWGLGTSGQLGDGTTVNKSSPVQIGTSSWSMVSAGGLTSAAILANGSGALFTWGLGTSGQLGDGTTINKSSPVQIGTSSWNFVSAGNPYVAAISTAGALFTTGLNSFGQLGDGTIINKSTPVQVATTYNIISSWTAVSAGYSHSMAIAYDGLLWGWGTNATGQLGDGTTATRSYPIQIGNSSWKSIGTSGYSAGITTTGALFAWGANITGQLGDGTTVNKSSPVQVGTSSWTMVSLGDAYVLGLTTTNLLYTWGVNSVGQLGDGTVVNKSSPVAITALQQVTFDSWKMISTGLSHTAAIRYSDASLWVWGNNATGQLGDGTTINKSSPIQIGTSSWSAVSAGASHTAGITTTGSLFTWGGNNSYQLGDGTTIAKSSPVQIGTSSWTIVSAFSQSAGITISGSLFTWGLNNIGQLGDGTTIAKSSPVQIGTSSWSIVESGASMTAGITATGSLFTWGYNITGQLGDGTTVNKSSPVQIGTSSWTAVTLSATWSAGITATGSLFTWGINSTGTLGDGTTVNKSSPVQIGTSSWSAISAGDGHAFGILINKDLYGWGNNATGQLGNNTVTNRSSPVQLGTSKWSMVSAGYSCSTGIDLFGRLFIWGANNVGQLGDGSTTNKSSPVAIATTLSTISSWSVVSTTASHSAAISSNGLLFTWGLGTSGQLGDGTIISKSLPIQIGMSSWSIISAGGLNYTSAVTIDKDLYTWGVNSVGQLGDGTALSKSIPTLIFTKTATPKLIAAGGSHTVAVGYDSANNNNLLYTWGGNANGQIGDNSILTRSGPVVINTYRYANNVTAGTNWTLKQ